VWLIKYCATDKNDKLYSHNGQCIRVSDAARSNEERAFGTAVQLAFGVGTVALYQPGLLIKMRHRSSLGTAGHTTITALNKIVQTLVTLSSV